MKQNNNSDLNYELLSNIPNYILTGFNPKFWYRKKSILSYLLIPISRINYKIFSWLISKKGKVVNCPVICVGNITFGGTGKTPLVHEIATEAKNQGFKVAILLRGYGRKIKKVMKVDVSTHNVNQVGDEALCHAKNFDVWVAPNRAVAGKYALESKANFIIMDDGLQHRHLHKDVSILLLPTIGDLGNLRCFPAGPLREDPDKIWNRVDACLHEGNLSLPIPNTWLGSIGSIFPRISERKIKNYKWLQGNVIAFCGIARSHRFFNHLKNIGANITATYSFPDHYNYTKENLENLLKEAKKHNSILISTAKDAIRIPKKFQNIVEILPYQIKVKPLKLIPDMIKLAKLRYLVRSNHSQHLVKNNN